MAAKLKNKCEIYLAGKLASALRRTAAEQGRTVDALVADSLRGYLRMVDESGAMPERWRAVPVDEETEAAVARYAAALEDDETTSLMRALVFFFDEAEEAS